MHERLGFGQLGNLLVALAYGVVYVAGALKSHSAASKWGERTVMIATLVGLLVLHTALAISPRGSGAVRRVRLERRAPRTEVAALRELCERGAHAARNSFRGGRLQCLVGVRDANRGRYFGADHFELVALSLVCSPSGHQCRVTGAGGQARGSALAPRARPSRAPGGRRARAFWKPAGLGPLVDGRRLRTLVSAGSVDAPDLPAAPCSMLRSLRPPLRSSTWSE